MKLVTAEQMRRLDETAINDYGIPGIVLMENAGRGTVEIMAGKYGDFAGRMVSIFVGPGNNGGDGLVIARHLYQRGGVPVVFALADPETFKGDAAVNYDIVRKLPIPVHTLKSNDDFELADEHLAESWIVVDALFGTGLQREVGGLFAEAIERINRFEGPTIAVDIPSGLNSDSGQPLGACVKADLTVTFGLAKPGQFAFPGAGYAGEVEVVDIGIPPDAVYASEIRLELLEHAVVGPWMPERRPADHKGTYGHLLVIAGSPGKTGAALLCAEGGLRSGAGLVSLCAPSAINQIFETALPEAMTIPLPGSTDGLFTIDDYEAILSAMANKEALVIGPGLGTAPATADLVLKLYREASIPMVVDADALNILALQGAEIKNPPALRVLTPHPGEMARLTGRSTAEVQGDRLHAAVTFSRENNVTVLLKGAGTVIAAPDRWTAINPTGNPSMATGGMGDVLAGLIGGLLTQGLLPWQAACLAAFAHGLAADRLAADLGITMGLTASEVAAELPLAFQEILEKAFA